MFLVLRFCVFAVVISAFAFVRKLSEVISNWKAVWTKLYMREQVSLWLDSWQDCYLHYFTPFLLLLVVVVGDGVAGSLGNKI